MLNSTRVAALALAGLYRAKISPNFPTFKLESRRTLSATRPFSMAGQDAEPPKPKSAKEGEQDAGRAAPLFTLSRDLRANPFPVQRPRRRPKPTKPRSSPRSKPSRRLRSHSSPKQARRRRKHRPSSSLLSRMIPSPGRRRYCGPSTTLTSRPTPRKLSSPPGVCSISLEAPWVCCQDPGRGER